MDTSLQTFFDQFSNEEKAIDFIGHHPDPGPDKGPWGYGPKDGMSWNWLNGFLGRHLGRFEQAEESLKTVLRLNDEWRDKSLATWKGEAKRCERINAFWQMTRDRSLAELERIANAREFRGQNSGGRTPGTRYLTSDLLWEGLGVIMKRSWIVLAVALTIGAHGTAWASWVDYGGRIKSMMLYSHTDIVLVELDP